MNNLSDVILSNSKTAEEAYADVQLKIKELEEQKDILAKEIIDSIAKSGETNKKTQWGTFIVAWRKSWEYSTDTMMLAEKFKTAKKREENDGTATIKNTTEYLRVVTKDEE